MLVVWAVKLADNKKHIIIADCLIVVLNIFEELKVAINLFYVV